MTQKEKIFRIVEIYAPIKTEEVEKKALNMYISGGSAGRYLRWLQEDGKIIGEKISHSKTKIWRLI